MNVRLSRTTAAAALGVVALLCVPLARADGKAKNPTSKFFVADLNGSAQVDTGTEIDDLTKKSVYNATGTVIETKPKSTYAMVYSNGSGAFFDQDTRVEVRNFEQEPFRPNRDDAEVEPSVSQTDAHVSRGTIGLCTSKLVAGSSMVYSTPLGSVNIRGRKVVIEVDNNETRISMIEGDSTVRGGGADAGGRVLHDGEQAVITPGPPGEPSIVKIRPIPADQRGAIEDRVTAACIARKTVYFQAVGQKSSVSSIASNAGVATSGVTAFDAPAQNSSAVGGGGGDNTQVIVAVPVVPSSPPVQYTVSDANLSSS